MKQSILLIVLLSLSIAYCSEFHLLFTLNGTQINSETIIQLNVANDGDTSIESAGNSVLTGSQLEVVENIHTLKVDEYVSVNTLSFELRSAGALVNITSPNNNTRIGMNISGLRYDQLSSCSYYIQVTGLDNGFYRSKSIYCTYEKSALSVASMFTPANSFRSYAIVITAVQNSKVIDTEAITDGEKVAIASLVPILFFLVLIAIYFGVIRKMRKQSKVSKGIAEQQTVDKLEMKLNKLQRENSKMKEEQLDVVTKKSSPEELDDSDSSEEEALQRK